MAAAQSSGMTTFLRTLFLLALMANLLLFAYSRGYFGHVGGGEPERLGHQMNPEKIRIVSTEQPVAPPAAAPEPRPAKAVPNNVCRMLSGLTASRVQRIAELAKQKASAVRYTERALDEPTSWWVFVPPQPDRRAADERVAELRRLGIADFFLIQEEGPNRFAISLGVFKTEQAAADYLQALKRRGMALARSGPRLPPDAKRVAEFRGPSEAVNELLGQIASEFSDLSPGDCPLNH